MSFLSVIGIKEPVSNKQLYEHCDIRIIFTKRDVIPVPRHWDPEDSITNGHTKQLYNKNWIPVSRTGMTGKGFEMTESNTGKLVHDRKLLFISSDIKSFFFAIRIE
ncbi:Predicted protein [Wolbachia endosymbiont strain TRS of Brugia malayi]|nr:Predicted protein [Wolbachia endosymbiont strain TRS of Brugia malayi]